MENKSDPRLHMVAATAIIEKDGRYLIMKRSDRETAFPGYWTVPGGKLVRHEYESNPLTPNSEGWYNVIDNTVKREVKEEANLEVKNVNYLTDMVFVRPDNIPALVLSYYCTYSGGEVKLGKDLVDFAWITPEEGGNYKIIPGILDEIKAVHKKLSQAKNNS